MKRHYFGFAVVATLLLLTGCKKETSQATSNKVTLALNWVPEPEFGGFYAAQQIEAFKKHGIEVEIQPGGAGAPVIQRIASGDVQFGIAGADEVVIARARGQDLVGIFTVYQTCPQGIMVHESRKLKSLGELFSQPGTIAMEEGLPYAKFLKKKFSFDKVKVVPYSGGVTAFLRDPNFSQQCFIFAEPLSAKREKGDPQTFLVADEGYNPYTAVVVTRGDFARKNPQLVRAMVDASREGWEAYLKDPKPANDAMHKLNTTMDPETFAAAAEAQKLLVAPEKMTSPLGSMTVDRWNEIGKQLFDLDVIEKAPAGNECMIDLAGTPSK